MSHLNINCSSYRGTILLYLFEEGLMKHREISRIDDIIYWIDYPTIYLNKINVDTFITCFNHRVVES